MGYSGGYAGGYADAGGGAGGGGGGTAGSRNPGEERVAYLNRLAGTSRLEAAGAANAYAGTVGMELVGALNTKLGRPRTEWLEYQGALEALAAGASGGITDTAVPVTAGLVAHYKANTLALTHGAAVATWADATATGATLTQATGANQPLYQSVNNVPSVLFDGTNDFLRHTTLPASNAQPNTYFVVARQLAHVAADRSLLNGAVASGAHNAIFLNNGTLRLYAGAVVTGAAFSADAPHVFEAVFSGPGNGETKVDGGTSVSGGVSTNAVGAGIVVGANAAMNAEFFNGHIYEVLRYHALLSDADRTSVRNYLKTKWSIA